MPPKLGCDYGYGRLYWKYSEKDPKWKVLKTYSSNDGITFECKLTKEEKKMPKFEIGDKVKVVKLDCRWKYWCPELANYIGKTGKIIPISEITGTDRYGVQFDDDWWCFSGDWLELVEKAKKYWSGTVVCVDTENEDYFVKGKVYKVKDGRIFGENHFEFFNCSTDPITELYLSIIFPRDYSYAKFIEFKGFAGEE